MYNHIDICTSLFFLKNMFVCVCVSSWVFILFVGKYINIIYIYIDTIIGKLDYLNNRSVAIYH